METGSWIAFNGVTTHTVVLCIVSLCLLMVSALVSGAETSFFSLSHNDVRRIRERRSASSEGVFKLLGNVELLLATILVVNNLVNICIVILTSNVIDATFTFLRFEFLFKSVLVTFLLLLFGEILPKVFAQTVPVRFACFAARPLLVLRWIFYPLSYILVRTSSRISEKAAHRSELSLDELADAVDMTQSSSPEEHEMLSGIVNFANTEVQEIMKPRVDITAIEITEGYEHVKRVIIESGFSRIPVYEDEVDNIRGTLYVKDLLPYINHGDDFAWQRLIRKAYFVPEHKKSTTCWPSSRATRSTWPSWSTSTARRSVWSLWRISSRRLWAKSRTRAIRSRASIRGSTPRTTSSTARPTSGTSSGCSSWRRTSSPTSRARPRRWRG